MHAVFAVEPSAINSWPKLRYIIEKFGFPSGVLIARYPKTWMRLVIEACEANNIDDIDKKRVVERLNIAKQDRMLKMACPYRGGAWLDNVLLPDVLPLFDTLILSDQSSETNSYTVDDLPEEIFQGRREVQVLRDAESLAQAASCLLNDAREITIVDPYLKPISNCINVLRAFVNVGNEMGRGVNSIIIHVAHSKDPRGCLDVKADYEGRLRSEIDGGLTLKVVRWNGEVVGFDFHARYLLSARAGLRYDRGFSEPSDHDARKTKTDVVCMEYAMTRTICEQYDFEENRGQVVDIIDIGGKR